MNRGFLYTVRELGLPLGGGGDTHALLLLLIVQFTIQTTGQTFTRQLPALRDNCVITPALTIDVYQPHTAAHPLFTAAVVRLFPSANSHTFPLHFRTVWGHKAELTFTVRTDK